MSAHIWAGDSGINREWEIFKNKFVFISIQGYFPMGL